MNLLKSEQFHYALTKLFRLVADHDQDGFAIVGVWMELATLGLPFSTPCMGRIRPRAFPYRFTASSVEVWGTNYPQTTANGGVDPTWECFVDNLLCEKQQLDDGPHVITVNVISGGHTFWFDYIRYTPSATGVRPLGATATFTTNFGAKMRFNFTGTGLSWVSFIPTELSHNSTSATYSMNGENPFSSMACHNPHVVHSGNSNETPLSLGQLFLIDPSSAYPSSSGSRFFCSFRFLYFDYIQYPIFIGSKFVHYTRDAGLEYFLLG
ncbi:hypothetical protein L208DRAFT_1486098 [Tricholoma matsutake]|nr:hypothetical protein L208DRAFT_1486098 [Tricholoma matsutake 945]